MSLSQTIDKDLNQALKDKEELKVSTLRMLRSVIKNVAIDKKQQELDDESVIAILQKEVKKRIEAAESFRKGNRPELADKEEAEKSIIDKYLPQMMGEEEISAVIDEIVAEGADNFGKAMGAAMAKLKGKADGSVVQKILKEKLQK